MGILSFVTLSQMWMLHLGMDRWWASNTLKPKLWEAPQTLLYHASLLYKFFSGASDSRLKDSFAAITYKKADTVAMA